MTPKEKSKELYKKYFNELPPSMCSEEEYSIRAYNCAMFCVDEIIKTFRKDLPEIGLGKGYWVSVRQELEKLK